jgi:hypothetical protein
MKSEETQQDEEEEHGIMMVNQTFDKEVPYIIYPS